MERPENGSICSINVIIRQNPTSKIWGKRTRKIENIVYLVDNIPVNENEQLRSRVRRELGIKTDSLIITEIEFVKVITHVRN